MNELYKGEAILTMGNSSMNLRPFVRGTFNNMYMQWDILQEMQPDMHLDN